MWERYLSWWASLAWSAARPCEPGARGVGLARSCLPFTPACARHRRSSLGWSWGKARLGSPSVSAAGCQGGGISCLEVSSVSRDSRGLRPGEGG